MQNFKKGIILGLYYVLFFVVFFLLCYIPKLSTFLSSILIISSILLHIFILSELTSNSIGEFLSKEGGFISVKLIFLIISLTCPVFSASSKIQAIGIMALFSFAVMGDIFVHILALICTLVCIHKKKRDLRNRYKTKKYNNIKNTQDN